MAALPTTLTPIRENSSETMVDKKLEVSFGGGYVQRGADGINPLVRTVSISFIGSPSDIKVYIDFFNNLKGYKNFQWTHPKDTVQRNWVVGDRSISELSENLRQLSTTFTLDYSLTT